MLKVDNRSTRAYHRMTNGLVEALSKILKLYVVLFYLFIILILLFNDALNSKLNRMTF